jgi:hypothetical protein
MRNLLIALLVVGFLAAPSFGVVNVKVVADQPVLNVGQSTTVRILAQGTVNGVYSLGGYISAAGAQDVLTSVGAMSFDPLFSPTGLFTPKAPTGGTNYGKGGWGDATPTTSGFGTQQTSWDVPNANLGKADYVQVAWYTVTADAAVASPQSVTLSFVSKSVSGYKPLETDKTGVLGTITNASIQVVPEPVTMALLAIGGLLVARRRR